LRLEEEQATATANAGSSLHSAWKDKGPKARGKADSLWERESRFPVGMTTMTTGCDCIRKEGCG
jgi:hypothetical protein